jgi:hypothetical protein
MRVILEVCPIHGVRSWRTEDGRVHPTRRCLAVTDNGNCCETLVDTIR